jgi:hypothetical protein
LSAVSRSPDSSPRHCRSFFRRSFLPGPFSQSRAFPSQATDHPTLPSPPPLNRRPLLPAVPEKERGVETGAEPRPGRALRPGRRRTPLLPADLRPRDAQWGDRRRRRLLQRPDPPARARGPPTGRVAASGQSRYAGGNPLLLSSAALLGFVARPLSRG